jgi:hypothetical protein
MYRPTDPQATFGSLTVLLSPEKIARLERNHWAGSFRGKALPVLLANEQTFRSLFCEDNGRPNKPVATTLGVLILKETFDLTDEAALDQFEFNASWQYALEVEPDEAHLCQKTLHNFRVKMSATEAEGVLTYSALFDEIVGAIIQGKGLKVGRQRLDSTHMRKEGSGSLCGESRSLRREKSKSLCRKGSASLCPDGCRALCELSSAHALPGPVE